MKSNNLIVVFLITISLLFSCNNAAKKQETTTTTSEAPIDPTKMASTNGATDNASQSAVMTLNAMFVSFTLGDGEHYTFKDKAGKVWNFGGCDDDSVQFGVELPEAQANETNQGWAANKTLQNKWFDLKYVIKDQPEYIDGPMAKVPVITEAKIQQ